VLWISKNPSLFLSDQDQNPEQSVPDDFNLYKKLIIFKISTAKSKEGSISKLNYVIKPMEMS
jgi:hypothetical protein